jgi:hypothetical protein
MITVKGPGTTTRRVEIVGTRDPDGGTDITVFVDGAEVAAETTIVDAGAGYTYADWIEQRDYAAAQASPRAAELIREYYDNPPGAEYIDDAPDGWPDEPDNDDEDDDEDEVTP